MSSKTYLYGGYPAGVPLPQYLYTRPQAGGMTVPIPGVSILPGISFPIPPLSPTPASPMPGPSASPASPVPTTPADLVLPILAIPMAVEGHPITSEYHNSLRNAILAIASRLGADVIGKTTTHSFAPAFFADGESSGWRQSIGFASRPAEISSYAGWFPVQLPEASKVEGLTVIGRRTGKVGSFRVRLLRQMLGEQDASDGLTKLASVPLVSQELKDAAAEFAVTAPVAISGVGAGVVEELKAVDPSNFKYIIHCAVTGASDDAETQLNAVQIHCRRY